MEYPISTPQEPAELVEYQPGSVVSRVVFRGPRGTVTVFAFAEGEGLTEHINPNDALVQVLDGEVTILIDGAEHRVGEGEMLHLPPNVPHELEGGAPFKMLLTLLERPRGDE